MVETRRRNTLLTKKRRNQLLVFIVLALFYIICNIITGGRILTATNIRAILMQAVFPAIVGTGLSFIIAAGVIDLSVGSQIILAASFASVFAQDYGFGYFGLILAALVICIACELLTFFCILRLKMPPWIAGLGMALIYEAICTIYMLRRSLRAGSSSIFLKEFRALGQTPGIFIAAVIALIIAYFLYNRTSFGMNLRASGSNPSVAEAVGIPKNKTAYLAAVAAACLFALAAVVQLSYTGQMTPQSGLGSLSTIFKALATALLASSFSNIFNRTVGIAIGAVVIASLFNVMTIMGVPSGTGQEIMLGLSVILCGVLANMGNKKVVK